jgi:hypothetical protein
MPVEIRPHDGIHFEVTPAPCWGPHLVSSGQQWPMPVTAQSSICAQPRTKAIVFEAPRMTKIIGQRDEPS